MFSSFRRNGLTELPSHSTLFILSCKHCILQAALGLEKVSLWSHHSWRHVVTFGKASRVEPSITSPSSVLPSPPDFCSLYPNFCIVAVERCRLAAEPDLCKPERQSAGGFL